MADTKIVIFNADGASAYVDYRTEGTNFEGRQVVVIGDPSTNAGVAPVDAVTGLKVNIGTDRLDIQRVHNVVDGTMTVADVTAFSARPDINRVHNVVDGTITVAASTNTIGNIHDLSGTATAHYVATGTFEGVSNLGKTLASPVASSVTKVYSISFTTTAQVGTVVRLTDGAGSATEYWRYVLQAPSQGIAGANIAVPPPGYLFATGSNTTLAIHTDNASLVHYTVAYFRESA